MCYGRMASFVPQKAIYSLDFPNKASLKRPQPGHVHLRVPKSIYLNKGEAVSKLWKLFLIHLSHPCRRRVVTNFLSD